jgi:hypothetical protein
MTPASAKLAVLLIVPFFTFIFLIVFLLLVLLRARITSPRATISEAGDVHVRVVVDGDGRLATLALVAVRTGAQLT